MVTKDQRIQQRPTEMEALVNAGVRAFIFLEGSLSRKAMVETIRLVMPKMLATIRRVRAPFVFGIQAGATLVQLYPSLEERK